MSTLNYFTFGNDTALRYNFIAVSGTAHEARNAIICHYGSVDWTECLEDKDLLPELLQAWNLTEAKLGTPLYFNPSHFNIERMESALNSPSISIPENLTREEKLKFLTDIANK